MVYIDTSNYRERLNKIKGNSTYSNSVVISSFKLTSTYQDDDFQLPIRIEGRLITADEYKDGVLPWNELQRVFKEFEGVNIYKYHNAHWRVGEVGKNAPIDAIVGRVVKTVLNMKDQAIDFFGEIMDRDVAFKVIQGLIHSVSVGFKNNIAIINGKPTKVDIEPRELTMVQNPKDKNAKIKKVIFKKKKE